MSDTPIITAPETAKPPVSVAAPGPLWAGPCLSRACAFPVDSATRRLTRATERAGMTMRATGAWYTAAHIGGGAGGVGGGGGRHPSSNRPLQLSSAPLPQISPAPGCIEALSSRQSSQNR